MTRTIRGIAGAASGLLVAAALLTAPGAGAAPTGEGADVEVLVILDASTSMLDNDLPGGVRRIDAAREAVRSVVSVLPEGLPTGLRVYGHRRDTSDRDASCRDTQLVSPVAALDRDAITTAVDRIRPRGFTPIARSLAAAADDFNGEGDRTVILVSDGIDTCAPPNPCAVAQRLRQQGIDLTVHTIGFALGNERDARRQLQCIAEATGGEYRDAGDARELGSAMQSFTQRAATMYESDAETVSGAPIYRDAPVLEQNRPYRETFVEGEAKWYAFDMAAGQEFSLEGIHAGGSPSRSCVGLEIHDGAPRKLASPRSSVCTGETASIEVLSAYGGRSTMSGNGRIYAVLRSDTGTWEQGTEVEIEFSMRADPPLDGNTDSSPSPEPTEEPTQEPTEEPTEEPTAEATEEPAEAETEAAASDSDGGIPPVLWAVIGLLVLLVLGLGGGIGLLLARQQQAAGSGPHPGAPYQPGPPPGG